MVEETARRVAAGYGYGEARTPIFEHTELFVRGVGEATDIVSKEMYTFLDRAERSITLRPEGTASIIRAYLQHSLHRRERFTKWYYLGPVFRYEKPQAGRLRQHHQFGVEAIGCDNPALDAEVIGMLLAFYRELGLDKLTLLLNSVGCAECRPAYNALLRDYLAGVESKLCGECVRRARENPLRVFDCKVELCAPVIAAAPKVGASLCGPCREHFQSVCGFLDDDGIEYELRETLVRGLDYYTRTAFEVVAGELGAQNAVGGGGRYDGLIETLGGPSIPAIGFGAGLERILMVLESQNALPSPDEGPSVSIVVWEEQALPPARAVTAQLRAAAINVDIDYTLPSLKSQLRRANRLNIPLVLIVAPGELERGVIKLKNMRTGEEREVPRDQVPVEVAAEISTATTS